MSNDVTDSPWVLNTVGVITTATIRVIRMEWVPAVTADELTIKDRNGRLMFTRKAKWTNESPVEIMATPMVFKGFELATIDGGTLYVWLELSNLIL